MKLLIRTLILTGICIFVGLPAAAQSGLTDPEKIEIPPGHTLVEVPAEYITVRHPVKERASQSILIIPPVYEQRMVDGKLVRRIIQPAGKATRVIQGPVRTRMVRTINKPISYAVVDANGTTTARYEWKNGKLVLVEQVQ